MSYVQAIAHFTNELSHSSVPVEVLERTRTCLLYNLCIGLAGDTSEDRIFDAFSSVFSASGACGILGSGGLTRTLLDATALNAALITARGQNDTHQQTVTHLGCVVIPAVLAIAQARGLGAQDVVMATLAGYEVIPKIARDAAAASTARGFRPTSLYSIFGAAAACAKALGLTVERTAHALAIASNSSGGLLQCWEENTPEWRLHIAHASRAGMQAALLAEQGMAGASQALEGANGFYRAFACEVQPLHLDRWDILDVVLKPYPGCAFNQSAIHTLRTMLLDGSITPHAVRSIRISMSPHDASYPGVMPGNPIESSAGALMSAPFMAAATLRDGTPKWRHFQFEYSNRELLDLSQKISVVADPAIADWQCEVEVYTDDGHRHMRKSGGPTSFAWNWAETVANMRPIVDEWSLPKAQQRFDELVNLLSSFGSEDTFQSLLTQCMPFNKTEQQAIRN